MLKYSLKFFLPKAIMYRKIFLSYYKRKIDPMHTIFNMVHAISDMYNIYTFQNEVCIRELK